MSNCWKTDNYSLKLKSHIHILSKSKGAGTSPCLLSTKKKGEEKKKKKWFLERINREKKRENRAAGNVFFLHMHSQVNILIMQQSTDSPQRSERSHNSFVVAL